MFPHELCILRHGQTVWNAEDRMQGRMNSPLTALGRRQAAEQGRILAQMDLSGWSAFASPQARAVETAGIALADVAQMIRTDERLCEIDVGAWNGKLRAEIVAERPELFENDDYFIWYDHAPQGEGYRGLELRCQSFLDELTGPAVLVCHGITSRMLRCLALGRPLSELPSLPGGQGNVFHLRSGKAVELT